MKLLIDIPEHIYEHAKESSEDSRDEFDAMRAIANGIQQESRSEIPTSCGDAISRKHLLEEIAMLKKSPWFNENTYGSKVIRKEAVEIVEDVCIKREPSVTPQQRTGRCKDCKYFEYDSVAKVDGIPLIVAHEICKRWGDGCKSKEDGYCFLFEPKMQEVQDE